MPIFQKKTMSVYTTKPLVTPKNPALVFSNSSGTDYTMLQAQIDALQKDFFLSAMTLVDTVKAPRPISLIQ